MFALNKGGWFSKDGSSWTRTGLPESGLNSAYQKYVLFRGGVYALGTMQGNYTNMKLTTRIMRTRDLETWETLAEKSNLPERVFYGAAVFRDRIWLVGGWDGKRYYNDVWNSEDGVTWRRVSASAEWSPRNATRLIVWKDRLWIIGGGVIDGDRVNNRGSEMRSGRRPTVSAGHTRIKVRPINSRGRQWFSTESSGLSARTAATDSRTGYSSPGTRRSGRNSRHRGPREAHPPRGSSTAGFS